MEKIRFIILAFLIGVSAWAEPTNVPAPVFHTYPPEGYLNAFVKHGKLLYQETSLNSGGFFTYLYQNPAGKWFMLQSNITGINEFFRSEIDTKEARDKFLSRATMTVFLKDNITSNRAVVLNCSKADLPNEPIWVPRDKPMDQKVRHKLQSYYLDFDQLAPVITGNLWTLKFNTFTDLGGVEAWETTGTVNPLQITSFTRRVAEADGTFPPIQ